MNTIEQLIKNVNETQRDQLAQLISNFLENANEQERDQVSQVMSNVNVQNRNENKTENFAKNIIEKPNIKKNRYVRFIESKSVNGIIYAGTQVGKSAATITFIKTCFQYNTPVIVSTDNKTDQQEQLFNRISKDFISEDITLLKVTDKKFKKNLKECISSGNKRFVIFCLDNSSQIEKLIEQLTSCYTRIPKMSEIKRIVILHDEADTIAKDQDINVITETQAKSHQKWLELRNTINNNMGNIDLKRIFVSATPENLVNLYNIECPDVMKLETPSNYTGYDKINHIDITDDLEVGEKLRNEVNRIKEAGTNEAILYCIDRKIEDGHNMLLHHFTNELNCIVNTYNGNGISTILKDPSHVERFERRLNRYNVGFIKNEMQYQMKNMSIRLFYKIMKSLGENCVLTIGKDLICRGISYVGEDTEAPITATVMFYRPGKNMNAVGICQTIGRITGCAMPNLERKLYCPEDVYNTYVKYNQNQETYIKEITKEGNTSTTKYTVDSLLFKNFRHPIDRPKLNIQMNMESDEETDVEDTDLVIDGVNLTKLRKWINGNTLVGKMIRYLYQQDTEISFNEFKQGIDYEKSDKELCNNIDNGRSNKCQYGKLWTIKNNYSELKLNNKIKEYMDKL
jgi:hypothetical protein